MVLWNRFENVVESLSQSEGFLFLFGFFFGLHSQDPSCDKISTILSLAVICQVFKTSMTKTPTSQNGQAVQSEWTPAAKT